ncbi:MAG: ABC transporter permease, partial [Gemmatimonadota bacterium]
MKGRAASPRPPPLAVALLHRCLPGGVVGLSILGDLHQEFDELVAAPGQRFPRLWFWRSAIGLSVRYALRGLGERAVGAGAPGSPPWETTMTWLADLRYGFRMLFKTPLLSAVAVLTVALGVALTTHTFSSVHGAMLRGIPVPDDDRLVAVFGTRPDLGIEQTELAVHDFEDLRGRQNTLDDVAAFYQGTVNIAGDERPPERFAGAYVSDNFFSHLGVAPLLGRTLRAGEEGPDAPHVIVLGYHVWQNRFAGAPDIVGRSIRVNGFTTEIVGVMPEGFRFPFLEDVWLPHREDAATLPRGRGQDFDLFGRLGEGVSLEAARAELSSIAAGLAQTYPETNENLGMGAIPYEDRFMPQQIQAVMWVMLFATFGVLLIACANVANLLMARASVRAREIAVRTALGAGRWRVVRQLMMESVALALVGGAVGVALAWVGVDLYRSAVADIYKPYWIEIRMDVPVLLFSLGVTLVASVAAGVWPSLRASGMRMGEMLKDSTRGSSSLSMGKLSRVFVISEIAVSCALLVGAGFMIKSIANLRNVDLGFETAGVMTGRIGLFENDYPDEESRDRFFTRLKQRLEAEPGVRSAALGTNLPGLGGARYFLAVNGETYATDRDYPLATTTIVSADYFATLGVDLSRGRDFTALETQIDGGEVAIVNESFAARYLPGRPAIGEQVRLGRSDSEWPWMTIVGVVPDMHIGGNVGGIGDDRQPPERLFLPQ